MCEADTKIQKSETKKHCLASVGDSQHTRSFYQPFVCEITLKMLKFQIYRRTSHMVKETINYGDVLACVGLFVVTYCYEDDRLGELP